MYLTLRLVVYENCALGYVGYRDVKIRFNDKIVKPLWWTDDVVKGYLGEYSFCFRALFVECGSVNLL